MPIPRSTGSRAGTGTEQGNRAPRRRRAKMLPVLALCAALLAVGACSSDGDKPKDGKSSTSAGKPEAPRTSTAVVNIAPADGATDVATEGALKVNAASGKLTQVTVTSSEGDAVEGTISPDGLAWQPNGQLRTGMKYSVSATAADAAGLTSAQNTSFTTLTPENTNYGVFNIDPDETYGVGMIVSLDFTKPVKQTAAVGKAVTVTSDPPVEVKGHWFGNQRLDFRPAEYWKPGTKVTLHLRLDGLQTSPGVYGKQSKDVSFTIGRAQTSVADNDAHTLTVTRDGQVFKTLKASLGDPSFTTYNGKMLIMSKESTVHMSSQSVGLGSAYDIPDVPHGMRLTTSGTYVHGNYWRKDLPFGRENTSHGCVSLQDVQGGGDPDMPAAWIFQNSLIGDVIEVVNSPERVVDPDNGWSGWNMTWDEWIA